MLKVNALQNQLAEKGYGIASSLFSNDEVTAMIEVVEFTAHQNGNFRKQKGLFAIRNLLQEVPALRELLWTSKFCSFISEVLGKEYFNTKAIYFDKPVDSNWSVAWHQDTTIAVSHKTDLPDFGPWTLKQGLLYVQPSVNYLENICAVRIHLDDCDADNGALKVVSGSHLRGIIPDVEYPTLTQNPETCAVSEGGVMLMKPLLLHASHKSASPRNRRVIHLEFSSLELPSGLGWRERKPSTHSNVSN